MVRGSGAPAPALTAAAAAGGAELVPGAGRPPQRQDHRHHPGNRQVCFPRRARDRDSTPVSMAPLISGLVRGDFERRCPRHGRETPPPPPPVKLRCSTQRSRMTADSHALGRRTLPLRWAIGRRTGAVRGIVDGVDRGGWPWSPIPSIHYVRRPGPVRPSPRPTSPHVKSRREGKRT